ncbi:MAG: O-antigen ligase family protein, partial [Pseudomonadota bacterium]|nr:O-antigen ligase family protein [Pseudomonadota bacterium]
GYAMATAIGFWLYLQTRVDVRVWRWVCLLFLMMGLTLAMARGPWVGMLAALVVFLGTGPNAGSRVVKGAVLLVVLGGVAAASPWGSRIIEFLPFVGTIDEGTVVYRQQIASASWALVQQNPFFGSPFFIAQMEEFRQGEGIIDLVNVYATVALAYGLVGLSLFAGFFAVAGLKCFAAVRRFANDDPDLSRMGSSLLACMVGALVIIATVSNYLIVPYLYWSLGALIVAYVQLAKESAAAPAELSTWNLHMHAR